MKIFKYNLSYVTQPEIVRLPKGSKVIDFQRQDNAFKMWALVDPEAKEEKRVFVLAFTGKDFDWTVKKIIGTRIVEETGIVVHLLELDPKTKATDPKTDDRLNNNSN